MNIISYRSIGALEFGDNKKQARAKLNSNFEVFAKVVGANETDAFDDIGLHLYYDDSGRLEFVEAFPPADIVFEGIHFLDRNLSVAMRDMNLIGFKAVDTDVGINFPDAGIALTAPSGVIEAVAAYRRGYYD